MLISGYVPLKRNVYMVRGAVNKFVEQGIN